MTYHHKSTGTTEFRFNDSLINGNGIEFMKLMRLLSQYNSKLKKQDTLRWNSFFIFRPKSQMSENDWKLISDSARSLVVGVESLVDHVRHHMRKKFTNIDLDHCLTMCKKYKIHVQMLLIVGYVTDTDETNTETVEWFNKNKHFAGDPIWSTFFTGSAYILPNTELHRRKDELGLQWDNKESEDDQSWNTLIGWHTANGKNDPQKRMRWVQEQQESAKRNGFYVSMDPANHLIMENYLEQVK
jgi:hypothetical protein